MILAYGSIVHFNTSAPLRHQECGTGKHCSWKAELATESRAPGDACGKGQLHDPTHGLNLIAPTSLSCETEFQYRDFAPEPPSPPRKKEKEKEKVT